MFVVCNSLRGLTVHMCCPRMVSGRKSCCVCEHVLGSGAAMVIEALSLCFHLACFQVRSWPGSGGVTLAAINYSLIHIYGSRLCSVLQLTASLLENVFLAPVFKARCGKRVELPELKSTNDAERFQALLWWKISLIHHFKEKCDKIDQRLIWLICHSRFSSSKGEKIGSRKKHVWKTSQWVRQIDLITTDQTTWETLNQNDNESCSPPIFHMPLFCCPLLIWPSSSVKVEQQRLSCVSDEPVSNNLIAVLDGNGRFISGLFFFN